ncbi:MAG: PEP-CTERM sorting domain-containing protein [Methylococcaceae bacterium]
MTYKQQTAVSARAGHGFKKKAVFGMTVALLGLSQQALAHVEYYDLNQGSQIGDLTAAGKTASTAQYGSTPAGVVALGGKAANGLGVISSQQDLALSNQSQWNATNQSYTGVGSFTSVTYTPTLSSATVNVNDVTDFGWGNGTKTTLGDSHKVDMFNFRLSEASKVNISWNVDNGQGSFFDNGFTLYSGLLQYQAHDDGNEKLNPKASTPPFAKVQDTLDGLTAPMDVQGIASSYRQTAGAGNPGTYVGQYNSLANWGQANVSGNWSNVAFLAAINGNAGSVKGFSANASDTLETLAITLGAGNYTIAASGALGAALAAGGFGVDSFGGTNLHGQLIFNAVSVAAVPVPAAVWMFLTGIMGVLGLNRRKSRSMAM